MNNTNQPIRFDKAGEILDAVIGTEGTTEEIVPMNLPENNETNPQTSPESIPEEAAFAPETREAEAPCEDDAEPQTAPELPPIEGIEMEIESLSALGYALHQNRIPIVRSVEITNNSGSDLEQSVLMIYTEPAFCRPFEQTIEYIGAGERIKLPRITVRADEPYLAALSERVTGVMVAELRTKDGRIASRVECEMTALCFDEWHGSRTFPELLAAFVTPNHPDIVKIIARASDLLGKWTGDPALDGYQSKDPNRILQMAAAVYGALQEHNIVYAVPPASFERVGQRIRLADAVMTQKMGTCLDLSVLYAACLEAIGLHPLLIHKKGHIFAGVWLIETAFPEAIQDDLTLLTKRLAGGVNEIALVECTLFTAGNSSGFDAACKAAADHLKDADAFEYILDVHRARVSGIIPLPARVSGPDGWQVVRPERPEETLTNQPGTVSPIEITEAEPQKLPKMLLWERKLLDLDMRNTLLNLRLTNSLTPLLCPSLDELEDALTKGAEFGIMYRPGELSEGVKPSDFEAASDLHDLKPLINSEFRNLRLRSLLPEKELSRSIVSLYRAARASLEENGANTLYLALGLLRWYESPRSQAARYAPIVLLPVEIVRKSANKGYVIRLRDDEPQINLTLIEMLKQDFGITVSGLDPLPRDGDGIDIRRIFATVLHAVMDMPRWDIVETANLGIFSFTRFVMWNDIRTRSEDLQQNPIVRSLIEGKLTWEAAAMDPGLKIPENTVLIPLPADASQLYAIESAAEGQSFVLHGPPGTGKSQTITALIANALARGKSILFIAEKMAALEVVQKRLKEIGIDVFCLELHSNKSKKRDVLEQLRAATEVTRETAPEEFERKAQLLAEMRSELDGYVNAVHSVQPCGMTAYQLINEYEANSSCPDIALFTAQQLEGMTREKLAEYEILAERLVAAARAVGHPKDHPLSPIRRDKYEQKIRTQFEPALEGYRTASSALKEAYSAFGQHFGAGLPATREDCLRTVDASRMLMLWKDLPESLSKADELEKAVSAIAAAGSAQVMASEQLNSILSSWKPEFLSLDSAALTAEWNEANGKWMLPRMMAMNALKRKLAPYATCDIDADTLPLHFQSLDKYRQLKAEADRMAASLPDGDSAFFQQEWKDITEKAKKAQESAQQMYELTGSDDMRLMCVGSPDAMKAAEELSQAWTDFTSKEAEMKALLDFDTNDISENWLERQQDIIDGILDSRDSLKDWMVWNQVAAECTEKGLGPIVQAYIDGLEHEKVLGAFRRSVYCTLTEMAIDQSETLSSFSGALMSEKIAQFKRMDKELMDLTRQEIYCRLAARVPNFTEEASQTSEIGILRRAIKSGGRGISIRRLLDQIPGLLPRLCPCMLMSPISAAQYLDPKRPPFDMVVFDEASQVPTCRAVGALARGKTAVIVGDPKQMPPTSFFTSTSEEDLTAEDGDLESILDDCLAINMPETHLLWHYRSRHESLIAFSNNQFYDNRLLTFPSAGDRESKVTLQHVDGVFDRGRGRSNRAEAEAVIAEMKRRCHDPALAKYSVGVVTFNVNQQHLIEDLLNEACRTDNKLEEWAWRSEEPVFIKNLENVQGDERDVILFSVGFGPDKNGKFYMNFGPLNRDGGWRRLNVAVSRARYEMKVFSTIRPEDIDLSRSSAEGVAALRAFLDYASGRPLPSAGTASILRKDKGQSGIANSIAAALRERGFECDISVGHSGYRVDVGVIDPRKPETYILGILLDGNSYRDAKTTRDREVAQESILTGLGWNILRLWSLDWWDNSRRETDRIAAAIVNLLEQPLPEAAHEEDIPSEAPLSEEVPEPSPSYEPEETPSLPEALRDPQAVEEYFPAVLTPVKWSNDEFMKDENTAELCSRLAYIVNCEAPVLQSTLIRRLLQSCGVSRGGARIQARALSLVDSMGLSYTMQGDERLYWRAGQDPQQFTGFRVGGSDKREPRDIPVIEAANAVCRVMENQIGLPMDGLVRETARILGYARAGSNVLTVVGAAIRLAQAQGKIVINEDNYVSLPQ